MDGFQLDWAALDVAIGALLPLLISFLKRNEWSAKVKRYVATAVSVVAAFVATWVQVGGLADINVLLINLGAIIATAQATYAGFWEDSGAEVALANFRSDAKKVA